MVELHKEHPADETPIKEAFAEVQRRLQLVVDSKHGEIPGFTSTAGLCRNCYWDVMCRDLGRWDDVALDAFRDDGMQAWDEFSGSSDFPVSCPLKPGDTEEAESAYHYATNLYVGRYGAARRRLAAHLLEWNEQHKEELFRDAEVLRAG